MNDNGWSGPEPPPTWRRDGAPRIEREATPLERFLGGSPGTVFLRLLVVSLIVGAFMMWLDIRPTDVLHGITEAARHIWNMGFGAIREIVDYVLVGAAIVVPLWLVIRLLNMRSR